MAAILSQLRPEGIGRLCSAFALVEAVCVRAREAGVELQMGAAMIASPVLCGRDERLADAARALLRIDREVLDPGAPAEADRLDVVVDREEARDRAVLLGDDHLGAVGLDRATQALGRTLGIPRRGLRAGRREQPLVGGDQLADVVDAGYADLHIVSVTIRRTPGRAARECDSCGACACASSWRASSPCASS